ncbi:hypothetical protein C8Q80DRAFT_657032 [Daedaleopsis nitida]|nr:hypothetical protein C8Q80DRAFT_657032 [Daedaleopsis nitida]
MALLLLSRQADGLTADPSALEGAMLDFPSLDSTFGAYLVGTFIGLVLYGFSVHQAYRYVRLFPTDAPFIRFLVSAVIALETVHAIFTTHTCYYYLTSHYFQPDVLNRGVWSLNWIPFVIAINMFISQLFFARRVYLMGKHYRIIVGIAMLFFAVEIGFAIAAVYEVIVISTFNAVAKVNHLLAATFAAAVVGDTLLTGSLINVLLRSRTSEYRRPESTLDMWILYIINTGLLHDALNVLSLVIVVVYPQDLIHGCISIVTTRIYGNTLLAVLNSRKFNVITRGIDAIEEAGMGMNIIARANRIATQERWNVPQAPDESGPPVINIHVTTEMGETSSRTRRA